MSAPRFTPGPWRYSDLAVYTDDANARDRVIIAELCGPGVTADRVAEYRANGHLLASAPDLYAALKECEWAGVRYGADACPICDVYSGRDHLTGCALAAALAKARGEG